MNKMVKGFILAGISGAAWGTYGTFVSILSRLGYSETAIATFAPVMLIVYFFISAFLRNPQGLKPNRKQLVVYIVCGLIGVLGTNLCYALAIANGLSVAIASVITFSNYFLVMVISRFVWNVRITTVKTIAGIMAVGGIFLLLEAWSGLSMTTMGLLFILIATLTFAASYCLTNYAINDLGSDPDAFYMSINVVGFVALLFFNPPWSVLNEIRSSVAAYGFVSILALLGFGLIPQVLSYFCLGRSFLYIDPPSIVIMFSLDPIVAALLGFFILGQTLAAVQILGMAIIIGALIWVQLSERKIQMGSLAAEAGPA